MKWVIQTKVYYNSFSFLFSFFCLLKAVFFLLLYKCVRFKDFINKIKKMETKNFIVTINREFGSGGREIGFKLGELLNVKVYDKAILESIDEKFHITDQQAEEIKSKKFTWWDEICDLYNRIYPFPGEFVVGHDETQTATSHDLYYAEAKLLRELSEQESCVIIGRTGFHIFKDNPCAFKIMIIANEQYRVGRIMDRFNLDEDEAKKRMVKADDARENFTKTFSNRSRYDARNYDLVLNVANYSTDDIAAFIAECVRRKFQL